MFTAIIVDDESIAIRLLQKQCEKIPNLQIVATTTNADEVVALVAKHQPHIVFLDIEIGSISGLDLAEQLMQDYPASNIIFVTAYSEYAVQAFDLNAVDYLLKPVLESRLLKMMKRLLPKEEEEEKKEEEKKVEVVVTQPVTPLTIVAFDNAHVLVNGEDFDVRTEKVEELFLYLWHSQRSPVTRHLILEHLWGDLPEEKAVSLMHSTFYQLRKSLQKLGYLKPITFKNKKYHLHVDSTSDVETIEPLLKKQQLSDEDARTILLHYTGDYFAVQNYEWTHTRRAELRHDVSFALLRYVEANKGNKEIVSGIVLLLHKNKLFNDDWLIALLHHFGQHTKSNDLINFFEGVQKIWQDDLGIDIPQPIQDIYSHYIVTM